MRRLLKPRVLLPAVLLPLLVLLALAGQEWRLFERAWFSVQEWRHAAEWQGRSLWLPDYQVVIEAQPIAGLEDDVSALTYDPDRRSLFSVTITRPS